VCLAVLPGQERHSELDAARAANRELIAQLNSQPRVKA